MKLWKHIEAWFDAPAVKEELKLCYQARHADQDRMKELRQLNMQVNDKYKQLWEQFQEYKMRMESSPSVHDADYWNDKWTRNRITYRAPHIKAVQDYVRYRNIPSIDKIASEILQTYVLTEKCPDKILKHVQTWREEVLFGKMKFKYKLDKTEKWNEPEETLRNNYGDCDDVGILLYFICRQIFVKKGMWDMVRHRLKCVAGNVNTAGKIPVGGGGHFYLIWLGNSGEWYVIETTWYPDLSKRKFLEFPQKADKMYGVMWFTFNEHWAWAQQDLHLDTFDWRKKKK